ncbi:ATP-binding protein [Reyranella aquatilis]|uniref:histidine kinase n=1 Tax=Reyranella aquatilis TaxID=2035356 RepID=A0ABS8KTE0_9HYPH|nr:ATP-binding protein [Reyranella aquatilis]MCC8429326.1 sensor histidine kinase N-terminal domain-containing protein [Reyranella aquatilis]
MNRFRSIISRVVALHVVAIGVTSILMPLALYWLLNEAANSLHRDALRAQALTIASFMRPTATGDLTLEIPPEAEPIYSGGYGLYAYAILDSKGRVLFTSRGDDLPLSVVGEPLTNDSFSRRRRNGTVLIGVNVPRAIGDHLYWIQVGQDLAHRDVIIDDIVASFLPRVAWITFPILLVLLLIDIVIFRRALDPVRQASDTAASIGPTSTDVRLSEQSMPAEIVPLVHAVNEALDRLEAGYRAQREFTADMAHELRTPLAIMRARVDSLEDAAMRQSLQNDIVNMTRTVNQVLDIAELEAFVVDGGSKADLQAVCADAVAFMAPLAVNDGKTIALTGAETPVWVRGHAEALFRAVRNLIENAIRHSPTGGTVEVDVAADGTVLVLDEGPGVPLSERETIFKRFWRRDRSRPESRGLGLAIVTRVAAAHDGTITVEDRPQGGSVFTLRLRLA